MRYAIISDIHANWQAWTAVLADIQQNQADMIICLGDVVGYGPRPEEVLTSVRQHTQNIVIGNHDAAACGILDASIFNDHARSVVEWTAARLSPESHQYLRTVPLTLEAEDMLFVHAEVHEPGRFGYIESEEDALHHLMGTQASIVFVGHTHKPLAYKANDESIKELPDSDFHLAPGHRYLVNVGSAGEPRDMNDIRARYVLYDSSSRAVYFRKVRFDTDAYRQDLAAVGLNIEPFFLKIIDHEASQGRDVLAAMQDHMMSVPEKAIFTGNQAASHSLVAGGTAPPPAAPPPSAPGDAFIESLPPPPQIPEAPAAQQTRAAVGGATRPQQPRLVKADLSQRETAYIEPEKSNNVGMIVLIIGFLIIGAATAYFILFGS